MVTPEKARRVIEATERKDTAVVDEGGNLVSNRAGNSLESMCPIMGA